MRRQKQTRLSSPPIASEGPLSFDRLLESERMFGIVTACDGKSKSGIQRHQHFFLPASVKQHFDRTLQTEVIQREP